MANYFWYKPKSKVLVLDANPDIQSKRAFVSTWNEKYKDKIEYVSISKRRLILNRYSNFPVWRQNKRRCI